MAAARHTYRTSGLAATPADVATSGTRHVGLILSITAVGFAIAALVIALLPDDDAATSAASGGCSVPTIAQNELPSVVTIAVIGAAGSGTGSGEVIDDSGRVLTNNHVISAAAGGGNIEVIFNDGSSQTAHLVGRDPQTDLAVLQVPEAKGLRAIRFGSSEAIRVGQPAVALGAPLGLSNTVTAGIVSARDRSVNVPADNGGTALLVAAIQTDAAINPGNSGGALVDCDGKLIGIPTAGATVPNPSGGSSAGNIGLGFAIPSEFARSIADTLIEHGSVTHGFLGLSVDTASNGAGLYVVAVTPAGPAEAAGLDAGDLITTIDGEQARSAEQLQELTLTHRPGETVTITYERQGATHETHLTLGSR